MSPEIISKIRLMHGVFGGGTPGLLAFKDGNLEILISPFDGYLPGI